LILLRLWRYINHVLTYLLTNECCHYLCSCSVLKVGVACMDDARYLLKDYRLDCVGCVDLRYLVPRTLPSANVYVEYCRLIRLSAIFRELLNIYLCMYVCK